MYRENFGTFVHFLPYILVATVVSLAIEVFQQQHNGDLRVQLGFFILLPFVWSILFYEFLAYFLGTSRPAIHWYVLTQFGLFLRLVWLTFLAILFSMPVSSFLLFNFVLEFPSLEMFNGSDIRPAVPLGPVLAGVMIGHFCMTLVYARWGVMLARYVFRSSSFEASETARAKTRKMHQQGGGVPFFHVCGQLLKGPFLVSLAAAVPEIFMSDLWSVDILDQNYEPNIGMIAVSSYMYVITGFAALLAARILADAYVKYVLSLGNEHEPKQVFQ